MLEILFDQFKHINKLGNRQGYWTLGEGVINLWLIYAEVFKVLRSKNKARVNSYVPITM